MPSKQSTRKSSTVKITPAQRRILDRLSRGEVIYQNWNTGKCWFAWETKDFSDSANKSTVEALEDLNLIAADKCGIRYRNGSEWYVLELTEEGKTALKPFTTAYDWRKYAAMCDKLPDTPRSRWEALSVANHGKAVK